MTSSSSILVNPNCIVVNEPRQVKNHNRRESEVLKRLETPHQFCQTRTSAQMYCEVVQMYAGEMSMELALSAMG